MTLKEALQLSSYNFGGLSGSTGVPFASQPCDISIVMLEIATRSLRDRNLCFPLASTDRDSLNAKFYVAGR
jgi:hypothetical protein